MVLKNTLFYEIGCFFIGFNVQNAKYLFTS